MTNTDYMYYLCMHILTPYYLFITLIFFVYIPSCPPDVTACLMATAQNNIDKDGILATRLCTHKEDVEQINNAHLQKLTSK